MEKEKRGAKNKGDREVRIKRGRKEGGSMAGALEGAKDG